MDVIACEASSTLSPPTGQNNAEGIKNRRFADIVLPNKDGCLSKFQLEISD